MNKPIEEEWVYDKLPLPLETHLHSTLKTKYGDMPILEGAFRFASVASSELGSWCADQVWALALSDEVLPKLEGSVGKASESDPQDSEKASEEIKRIQEANQLVKEYIANQTFTPSDLSSKVELLMRKLQEQFAKSPDTKCIVFTQRRNTAKVLLQLCEKLQFPNLRPDVLVGVRKGDALGMNSTFRRQFLVLVKFRKSEINCLVSFQQIRKAACRENLIILSLQHRLQRKALTSQTVTWWLGMSSNILIVAAAFTDQQKDSICMTRLFNMSKAGAVPDAPTQWLDFIHFHETHLIYSLFRSTQPWLNVAIATTARDYRKFEEQR